MAGDLITAQSAQYSIDLLLKYQLHEQRYFWEKVIGTKQHQAAQLPMVTAICNWIVSKGPSLTEFSLRDMSRYASSAQWIALSDNDQAKIMSTLEDAWWVEPDMGKPSRKRGLYRRYSVNPGVHVMYAGNQRDQILRVRQLRRDDLEVKRGHITPAITPAEDWTAQVPPPLH